MVSELCIDFIAGCVGGAAGVLAGHPLDTIKVRLQTQKMGTYRGITHCFTSIVKEEKVRGLYKGMSSPLSSLTLVNAIVFGVHGAVAKQFDDQKAIFTHFVAGCSAGIAQAFVSSPTELLKLRVQIKDGRHPEYRSPFHCLRSILQETGPRTLFRGMFATQLRDCPGLGIYFASYEFLARSMSKDGTMEALTSLQLLCAGGFAGMLSWLFNYPTDVIKTRFQAGDEAKTYGEVIRKTYAERGIKTFFVGFGSTLLRAFPTNAATFFTVEWTYRILLDYDLIGYLQRNSFRPGQTQRYVNHYDVDVLHWNRNSFLLPEAGSTFIEPMILHARFAL
ncbi:Mitochondrial carrier protein [Aphelenchoides fujianensis]|nr:Mitochondrial carrier protein [Aphelenchoides fujianensis]